MTYTHYFRLLLVGVWLTGCSVKPTPPTPTTSQHLTRLLHSLGREIPADEAKRMSGDLFTYTAVLTQRFRLTRPPIWHNFLVNVGLRQAGLCYHWSDALYRHLTHQHYPHFAFHLVGANIGEYLFEHNALVITAKGGAVEEGVLIDPWRNSGRLYFAPLSKDSAYHWIHRKERER